MPKISLQSVSKRFPSGCEAVREVEVDILGGSFTVVLGPSGAGKSTLLRLMNGLENPTSGRVLIDGERIERRNLRKIRSKVAMVFQQFNLVDRLSVVTNVLIGRLAHRSWVGSVFHLFRKEDMYLVQMALSRVGLIDKAWCRADQLSGGQQQRVGIARALAQQPEIILADEPVASLDPVSSEQILTLLREICDRDKIALVVNLHQLDLARRFADRIVGMNDGKIVFDGTPDQLTPSAVKIIYQRESPEDDRHVTLAVANA